MVDYGLISVIPTVVVLVISLAPRRVFESLFLGGIAGCIILSKQNILQDWLNAIYSVLADSTFDRIMLVTVLFGDFVVLMKESGGISQFSYFALRDIKTQKGSLMVTWILGVLIFIDDYLNILASEPLCQQ